jgi:hypothetical protein
MISFFGNSSIFVGFKFIKCKGNLKRGIMISVLHSSMIV